MDKGDLEDQEDSLAKEDLDPTLAICSETHLAKDLTPIQMGNPTPILMDSNNNQISECERIAMKGMRLNEMRVR